MKTIVLPILMASVINADVPDVSSINQAVTGVGGALDVLNNYTLGIFSLINRGEIQYGRGTVTLEGGFLGAEGAISDRIATYTLKKEHQNFSKSAWNYGYKISWYDSELISQSQSTYNGYVSDVDGYPGSALIIPPVSYRIQGLDADVGIGYNIINHSEHDYLSIGIDTGLTLPVFTAAQLPSDESGGGVTATMKATGKTRIQTFKVGPQIKIAKSITSKLWLYGSSVYAYQHARIRNSSIDLDARVNGSFMENELGLMYRPFHYSYRLNDWISISPQLYFSTGYRYSKWLHYDTAINLFDTNIPAPKGSFSLQTATSFLGVGYSF